MACGYLSMVAGRDRAFICRLKVTPLYALNYSPTWSIHAEKNIYQGMSMDERGIVVLLAESLMAATSRYGTTIFSNILSI